VGSPAKYVWGRKNCAIFAISRKQDANRVTVKGEHEVMATLPSKESVQRNKLETRAHRCRLDVRFASHLSVVVVVCSGESAICSVLSVTAGHVPRNGSFIAASPASRFTSASAPGFQGDPPPIVMERSEWDCLALALLQL